MGALALAFLSWIKDHKALALSAGLAAALGVAHFQLWAVKVELASSQAEVLKDQVYSKTLEAKIDEQSQAIEGWRVTAQKAQAEARQLRTAAEVGYQAQLAAAKALLDRPKEGAITCPQAWDRLFQALQGVKYTEAP